MAGVHMMAECATFEAEGALWVTKGTKWCLRHGLVWLFIWSKAVRRRRSMWGLWVGQASHGHRHPGVQSCSFKLMVISQGVRVNDKKAVHER